MLQMLKAIMRLDKDQWAQSKAREAFSEEESQYYEIEIDIFFDDAFEQGDGDDEDDRKVNRFVEQLVEVMNEAAVQVLEENIIIGSPTIVPTPYGGKLIWKLPGGNRLIAHIKDKDKIRHRKRWSQVGYFVNCSIDLYPYLYFSFSVCTCTIFLGIDLQHELT